MRTSRTENLFGGVGLPCSSTLSGPRFCVFWTLRTGKSFQDPRDISPGEEMRIYYTSLLEGQTQLGDSGCACSKKLLKDSCSPIHVPCQCHPLNVWPCGLDCGSRERFQPQQILVPCNGFATRSVTPEVAMPASEMSPQRQNLYMTQNLQEAANSSTDFTERAMAGASQTRSQ